MEAWGAWILYFYPYSLCSSPAIRSIDGSLVACSQTAGVMAMLGVALGTTAAALQERADAEEAATERRERAEKEEEGPTPTFPIQRRPGRSRGDSAADNDEGQSTTQRPRAASSPSPPPVQLPRFLELGLLSSIVAGWSAIPSFAPLVSVNLNAAYLRFGSFIQLFLQEAEAEPSAAAVAFQSLRTLSLLFTARNGLAMAWDSFVGASVYGLDFPIDRSTQADHQSVCTPTNTLHNPDSIRERPFLNPLLYRNVQDVLRITGFEYVCALWRLRHDGGNKIEANSVLTTSSIAAASTTTRRGSCWRCTSWPRCSSS